VNLKKLVITTAKNAGIALGKKSPRFRDWARSRLIRHRTGLYRQQMRQTQVDSHVILFESFMGRKYACSPKAIYEYMAADPVWADRYTFKWAFREEVIEHDLDRLLEENPALRKADIFSYGTGEYMREYAAAGYFITNSRLPEFIVMREGQKYVQCWHGTPLKRLGYDIIMEGRNAMNTRRELIEKYDIDAVRFSYMISPSAFCTEKLRSAFNLPVNNPAAEIIEEGYPRNDALFHIDEKRVRAFRKKLGLDADDRRRLILYAPTWRDDQHKTGTGYTYELAVDFDKWQRELGDAYVILFRAHYFVANTFDFSRYENFVIDASGIDDINDLYVMADMLITDYSSVFFDYADLKRPILFYMYDLEEYKNNIRDFYIDLDELPGDIVTAEDELLERIRNFDYDGYYDERYRKFNDKYNYLDDGEASRRVVEKIFG
jgi:CDP-glycerol glycerophosphotransferase